MIIKVNIRSKWVTVEEDGKVTSEYQLSDVAYPKRLNEWQQSAGHSLCIGSIIEFHFE